MSKRGQTKEGAQLEEQYDKAIKEGVQKNITNPVGVFLFKQTFYNNSTDEMKLCCNKFLLISRMTKQS